MVNPEEWHDIKEKLPEIGQRVRALVVKELTYKGFIDNGHSFTYDNEGEHGIYSWCPLLKVNRNLINE